MTRRAKVIAHTLCFAIVLSAVATFAQTTRDVPLQSFDGKTALTTAPATQSVAVDPSTPRGALKSLIHAMETGDGDQIKSLIATSNPSEDKMVAAMANMSVSQKKFRDAADTAFGANSKELTGDTNAATTEGMAKIDAAQETINGDKAVIDSGPAAGTPPLTLTKSGNQWKIPISELSRGVDQSTIDQRLADLAFMSGLMNDSATEISKGTYKTPKDAGDAIKSKMMTAMMQRAAAATRPTTAPADSAQKEAN
ncbi:MAG: hypothetical protein JO353_12270 [Phycisphaerae bacterium]|nr:hypothetical protein [Phycisphaerae bacterium]